MVPRIIGNSITDQPFLFYLRDTLSEQEFYNNYFIDVHDEDGDVVKQKPLSAFYYEEPFETLVDAQGEFKGVEDLPTSRYSELDPNSYYANERYDNSDPAYIQPRTDDGAKKNYSNNVVKQYTKEERAFYNELLRVMSLANSYIPNYIDTRSHRAPGITEKMSHFIFRKNGPAYKNFWSYFATRSTTVDDTDTDYNDELAIAPNGDRVYTIPLRWIRRLDDPTKTNTDAIGCVVSYYEMALNYSIMSKLQPIIQLFLQNMQRGSGMSKQQQYDRLAKFVEMNVYQRMRDNSSSTKDEHHQMTRWQKFRTVALDKLRRNAILKMMAKNYRGILKNFLDAGMSSIVEMMAAKYFDRSDVAFGIRQCSSEILPGIRSINTPNNVAKISAAMQLNGQSGSIRHMFSDLRDPKIRRFVSRYYSMGEYTFTDYVIKGWITPAIYHSFRLIDNFDYREVQFLNGSKHFLSEKEAKRLGVFDQWQNSTVYRKEYMNKQQAIYSYIKAGKTRAEGEAAYKNQKKTLWDAFHVDDKGNFVLNSGEMDYVRPFNYSTGRRSTKIESRVYGTMKDRFAVIAGMLPDQNKGPLLQSHIGLFIFMLRGWLITFWWDCFKGGNDFAIHKKNPKSTSKQQDMVAEDIDLYNEIFEFSSGQSGRGWLRSQPHAWKVIFINGITKLLNLIKGEHNNVKHLNNTNRRSIAKM